MSIDTSFHPSSPVDHWGQFLQSIQPADRSLSDTVTTPSPQPVGHSQSDVVTTAPPEPSPPPLPRATRRPRKKASSATDTSRRKTAAKDAQKTSTTRGNDKRSVRIISYPLITLSFFINGSHRLPLPASDAARLCVRITWVGTSKRPVNRCI
jgi:hypothetical protein